MGLDLDQLKIVHYPHPALKKVCQPVTEFGPELRRLTDRMLEMMVKGEGVGLAAPQVGLDMRLFVCSLTGERKDAFVCVNPRFTEMEGAEMCAEGCLSLPGVSVSKRRATRVVLEGFDVDGNPLKRLGEGLEARVWQHESDHLDGRLLIDRMSEADEIANRRAVKQMVEDYSSPQRGAGVRLG